MGQYDRTCQQGLIPPLLLLKLKFFHVLFFQISPCFDKVDNTFKAITQHASNQFTQKKANLNAIEKSYIENLYRTLSKLRQCIIAKLKP